MSFCKIIMGSTALSFCAALAACSSVKEISGTQIAFDVENGYYESFRLDTWELGDNTCTRMIMRQPYFGESWDPVAGFSYRDEAGSVFINVELIGDQKDSASLITRYMPEADSAIEKVVINPKVSYGEIIDINLRIFKEKYLVIEGDGVAEIYPISFTPASLLIHTSSAKASIGIECDESDTGVSVEDFDFDRNGTFEENEREKWRRFQKNNEMPLEFFDSNRDGVTTDEEIQNILDQMKKMPGVTIEEVK